MDDLFEEINCRSKSDSIVMRLLRSAMDEAHEKVQSQNGPIEFLHERSKFYELAAILVDGSLNIVEEEEDIQETNREEMLSDLTEIKHWLQRRIAEMRILIIEKDKELMERVENELKLRRAAELNARELAYLREKLETERTKGADLPDYIPSSEEIEDDRAQGGDIRELKSSVDQQVLNIKQKLEDERKTLTRRIRGRSSRSFDSELYSKLFDEDIHTGSGWMKDKVFGHDHVSGFKSLKNSINPGKNNVMIQQMSSDIDILKGTLDLAFGRMRNAEVFPLEKQWTWSIEKDVIVISVKGFINDIQQNFKTGFEKRGWSLPVGFSREKWTELINNARALHDELSALCSQGRIEEKGLEMHELSGFPSSIKRTTSEPLPEVSPKVPEKDSDPGGSHYVAKMVKNHESFIQKQRKCEEWNWLAREVLRRQGPSSIKRDKDPDELESRIRKVIERLDNLMMWDGNPGYNKGFCDKTAVLETSLTKIDRTANENINAGSGVDLSNEIRKLEQERDDLKLQSFIIEEIFLLILVGFAKSLYLELLNENNESLIRGDSHNLSVNDSEDHHGVKIDDLQIQKAGESEEETACEILQHYLESSIRENVYAVYFQQTVIELDTNIKQNADDYLVKQELMEVVFGETLQCIEKSGNLVIRQLQIEIEGFETLIDNLHSSDKVPETVGSLLKEDIYIVYFRELFNRLRTEIDAYNIEILIKDEIYQFVLVALVKEFFVTIGQSETWNQVQISKDFPPTKLDMHPEQTLIEKPDSYSRNCNIEEIVNTSNQTKELRDHCVEVAEDDSMELLSYDVERTFGTESELLEISSDKLLESKASVPHMENSSGSIAKDQKEDDHQALIHPTEGVDSEGQYAYEEENQQNRSVFSPVVGFQRLVVDFEQMVHKKLESYCLRVETLKRQTNGLAHLAASIRKKKSLYKKAFITRSRNLQLAETEVDLLGNQVDRLLCLLENIYLILRQNSTVLSPYFGVSRIMFCINAGLCKILKHYIRLTSLLHCFLLPLFPLLQVLLSVCRLNDCTMQVLDMLKTIKKELAEGAA
nr:uncharacterized protein LOC113709027 [Coffea arabica]